MKAALPPRAARRAGAFTETATWKAVGSGWRQLAGNFQQLGFSIEWHDFVAAGELDWAGSFHPQGLELCLNLAGTGEVWGGGVALQLWDETAGFYAQSERGLCARRRAGQRHRFLTIELSAAFLKARAPETVAGLHPSVARWFEEKPGTSLAEVSEPTRLSSEQQHLMRSLQQPPVCSAAQPMWYRAKALELASTLLYRPIPGEEWFCQRVKRLNRERAQRVRVLLQESLAQPPSLEQLGRRVGCSPFHLSRIFTQETGQTITQCLRQLRLERAAVLLRSGQCNVTEAALEVGYNSLSHFTAAFRETFGCCPGLYPLPSRASRMPGDAS